MNEENNELSPCLRSSNDTDKHEMNNDEIISTKSQQDKEHQKQRKYNHIRLGLYVFSACYTTLFAGAFYGWGPMQLLLEEDDAFAYACEGINTIDDNSNETLTNSDVEEDDVCPEQTQHLINVSFVATLTMILAPLFGHIVDTSKGGSKGSGTVTLMTVAAILECIGIGLLLMSTITRIDWILYIAFSCIASVSIATCILIVSTGMTLFDDDDHGRRQVISSLNILLDAGSITYWFLWYIHKVTSTGKEKGESIIEFIFLGYLIIAIICFSGSLYFWNKLLQFKEEHRKECTSTDDDITTSTSNIEERHNDSSITEEDNSPNNSSLSSQSSTRNQLLSIHYISLVIFFCFHLCRNSFTLTTARDYLASVGDNDDHLYLTVFTLTLPTSILTFPFVDTVLKTYGYNVGFQLVNTLAIIHGSIQVLSSITTLPLKIQIIGFVTFTFYRALLFSVVFSFIPIIISPNKVGIATAALQVAGGISCFINIPLGEMTIQQWNKNFTIPCLLYTVLIFPLGCTSTYMLRRKIILDDTTNERR